MTRTGVVVALSALAWSGAAASKAPDCSGPDRYPSMIAHTAFKNAGVFQGEVDWPHVRSRTIASEQIGKNLWRQVFRVSFPVKDGKMVEGIVVEEVSNDECSMSSPQIFLISKAL